MLAFVHVRVVAVVGVRGSPNGSMVAWRFACSCGARPSRLQLWAGLRTSTLVVRVPYKQ